MPVDRNDPTQPIVLVTGPSGAGRATAINALEDLGFEAIDNLPLSLIPRLLAGPRLDHPLALGLDVRNRDFTPDAVSGVMDQLSANPDAEGHLLFVDADVDTLIRRYSETRRRHPLSADSKPRDGIEQELRLLEPLKSRADILIDTSELTPHDLRAELVKWFASDDSGAMTVTVESFSYKRGLPRGADLVWDCRFLNNPHWEETLRPKNGTDEDVASYVRADPRHGAFMAQLNDMADLLLPAFRDEGKSHLAISIGCTGGQHRSVAVAEEFGKSLANKGWQVSIRHREIERRRAGDS
ncbi:RNase adapter RapZ [uncultured Litoreibacter sp.]|uniref:RNase adapter RapZ n=1 Tax=uncultured Litoreibacter sp. TaxID=1392394 RepID=UPI002603CBB5|nr:RNase adapter RapZ [uncultured Litoreibacter sp.]